jgi:hypothetical protein
MWRKTYQYVERNLPIYGEKLTNMWREIYPYMES